MSYKETKYYRLPTRYGDLVLWANGENADGTQAVGFRTLDQAGHSGYRAGVPEGGADDMPEAVTINRVAYRVHGFARLGTDGTVRDFNSHSYGGSLTRAEAWSIEKGSDSANRAFAKAMTEALEAWAITDEARAILRDARHRAANNEADSVRREIAELEEKLAEKRAELKRWEREAARNA